MSKKKKASWKLDGWIAECTHSDGVVSSYDLTEIYPEEWLDELETDAQKEILLYGTKKGLSDFTARDKDSVLSPAEARAAMDKRWALWKAGKWTDGVKGQGVQERIRAKVERETLAAVARANIEKYRNADTKTRKMLIQLELVREEWVKDIK